MDLVGESQLEEAAPGSGARSRTFDTDGGFQMRGRSAAALLAGMILSVALFAPVTPPAAAAVRRRSAPRPARSTAPKLGPLVRFPEAGVQLARPALLSEAKEWRGFGNPSLRASVLILRLPEAFEKLAHGFTAEHMQPRGMKLLGKQPLRIEGQSALLIHFTQSAGGTEWEKWALALGDATHTVLITATFPAEHRKRLSPLLEATLRSTRLDPEFPQGRPAQPPFQLGETHKLKAVPDTGLGLAYTEDGLLMANRPESPLFVAAPSLGPVLVADPRAYAEEKLRQTAKTTGITLQSHEPITIDGLSGFESLAEAKDEASDTPLTLYQVLLFDADRYVVMVGIVGAARRDDYLPEFRALARGFRRRPAVPDKSPR